jgi:hypothetical protein
MIEVSNNQLFLLIHCRRDEERSDLAPTFQCRLCLVTVSNSFSLNFCMLGQSQRGRAVTKLSLESNNLNTPYNKIEQLINREMYCKDLVVPCFGLGLFWVGPGSS